VALPCCQAYCARGSRSVADFNGVCWVAIIQFNQRLFGIFGRNKQRGNF